MILLGDSGNLLFINSKSKLVSMSSHPYYMKLPRIVYGQPPSTSFSFHSDLSKTNNALKVSLGCLLLLGCSMICQLDFLCSTNRMQILIPTYRIYYAHQGSRKIYSLTSSLEQLPSTYFQN